MSDAQAPAEAPRQPLPWQEKQAAYEALRAAWGHGQRLIEAERIRQHGAGK